MSSRKFKIKCRATDATPPGYASKPFHFCEPGKPPTRRSAVTAIDLFAGAGGFSIGAEQAGAHVAFAINHYPAAVAAHMANHPHTMHCCEDIFQFNWASLVNPKGYKGSAGIVPDIVLAAPSCKTHSKANVARKKRDSVAPEEDMTRANPAAIVSAVAALSYRADPMPPIVVENTENFLKTWKGYSGWKNQIEEIGGYTGTEVFLNSLDFGVPQDRKRLFVIFVPGKTPFDLAVPPKVPTGRNYTKIPANLRSRLSIGSSIVRDYPGPDWEPLDQHSSKKLVAFAQGQKKRIKTNLRKPVPPYWSFSYLTSGVNPRTPDMPMRTLTAKLGSQTYMVHSVRGRDYIRQIRPVELKAFMGFPKNYILPASPSLAGELIGNAVVPAVARHIVAQLIERVL